MRSVVVVVVFFGALNGARRQRLLTRGMMWSTRNSSVWFMGRERTIVEWVFPVLIVGWRATGLVGQTVSGGTLM